jgi:hypothetical protein
MHWGKNLLSNKITARERRSGREWEGATTLARLDRRDPQRLAAPIARLCEG